MYHILNVATIKYVSLQKHEAILESHDIGSEVKLHVVVCVERVGACRWAAASLYWLRGTSLRFGW